jgi:hypothetical protein
MNFDNLIDFNLNLLIENKSIKPLELKDTNDEYLSDELSLTLFKKMVSENLIDTDNFGRIQLLAEAYKIIEFGGWLKHIEYINEKQEFKEKIEIDLAKSNLKANELNRKIAKQNKENEKKNRVSTWVNIIIGLLNFFALIWQIIKSE